MKQYHCTGSIEERVWRDSFSAGCFMFTSNTSTYHLHSSRESFQTVPQSCTNHLAPGQSLCWEKTGAEIGALSGDYPVSSQTGHEVQLVFVCVCVCVWKREWVLETPTCLPPALTLPPNWELLLSSGICCMVYKKVFREKKHDVWRFSILYYSANSQSTPGIMCLWVGIMTVMIHCL